MSTILLFQTCVFEMRHTQHNIHMELYLGDNWSKIVLRYINRSIFKITDPYEWGVWER